MPNQNCPFRPDSAFFMIDSDNCREAVSALYGFCIVDSVIYNRFEDLKGARPTGEGSYVLVTAGDEEITIEQDLIGCYGLYLYQQDGYFAISNSLMYLAQRLKDRVKLTVDQDYLSAYLVTDLCSHVMHDTPFQEIKWLNRAAVVHIPRAGGSLSLEYIDYLENTVPVDSPRGIALLDQWYRKWTRFIHNLAANTDNLCTDLSGGFDSRLTLALFLGAQVDMSRVYVYSIPDDLHTHSEDYKIASELGKRFGFPLNNRKYLPSQETNVVAYSREDTLNLSAYLKMGLHKQFHWRNYYHLSPFFHFTGSAGGCLRTLWDYTQEEFVAAKLKHLNHYGLSHEAGLQYATRKALNETYERIQEKYRRLGRPLSQEGLSISRYRETRLTNHFGKALVESLLCNAYEISPLIDPTIYLLTLSSTACEDKNLLVAILLDRYAPGLLEVPFEGGRSIAPETLAYAREVNRRFPYVPQPLTLTPASGAQLARLAVSPQGKQTGCTTTLGDMDDVIVRLYHSDPVRDTFSAWYSPVLYEQMCRDIRERSWQPLQSAQLMAAVTCAVELADRPGVFAPGETLGAHLLRYADLPRRPRLPSLSSLPDTEYANILLLVAEYVDQPEGSLTPECRDRSAFLAYSKGLPNGFLARSSAGTCRVGFTGSRSGQVRIRLSGCKRQSRQGQDLSYPIDLQRVVYNDQVCMEGHQTVRYRRRFVMFQEIKAGETCWVEAAWLPYGVDLDCASEPMDASMCTLPEDCASLRQKREALKQECRSLKQEYKALKQKHKALRQRYKALDRKASAMRRSLSWKLGRLITLLPRKLKKLLHRT